MKKPNKKIVNAINELASEYAARINDDARHMNLIEGNNDIVVDRLQYQIESVLLDEYFRNNHITRRRM
jgi:hypothetical protein